MFPLSLRASPDSPLKGTSLFSICTAFIHLPGSSLQNYYPNSCTVCTSKPFCSVLHVWCLVPASLCHWNHSHDFCFFEQRGRYLYLHWSVSFTFVDFLPTLSFLSTLSPWLSQLHPRFSLLTAEASVSSLICHGNLTRLSLLCLSLRINT